MSNIKTHDSSTRIEDGIKIIELHGSIDIFNINDVMEYIKHILNKNQDDYVVFDMGELDFITAQGIAAFTSSVETLIDLEKIYLLKVNKKNMEMFNLLGFGGCYNFINNTSQVGITTNIFPVNIICPSCEKTINIKKNGRFACTSCKSVISINNKGKIE